MKVNNRSYIWSVFALFELNCLAAASGPAFDLADPDKKLHEDVLHYTNGGMYGWTFTILQPVTVTGLGWYDNGGDGLFHPHEIGIWPGGLYSGGVSSELLGSITIPSSTAAPLESYYRKLDLPAELTLSPGEYTVAGTHIVDNEDPVSFYDVSISVPPSGDPRFVTGGPAYAFGGGFRPPDRIALNDALLLGPMLFVETIPEPSTLALFAVGALLLIQRRIRKSE